MPLDPALSSTTPLDAERRPSASHDHLVGIYRDADHLVRAIVDLVAPGLAGDDAAVVVASRIHREGVVAELSERGIDVAAHERDGRLHLIDAAELLDTFRSPDGPDPARFRAAVEPVLERARADGRQLRLFGEMVTLLWDEGDVTGALELEDLWNELLADAPATLLCGYPADAFAHERSTAAFQAVCDRHSDVVTDTIDPTDDRDRLRRLAMLEHERVVDRNRHDDLEARHHALTTALAELREATARRDELLAVVVHDIRSPATMITSALRLVLDAGTDLGWDDTRAMLETAHEAGERIVRLSRDIVADATAEPSAFTYDLRPVDLRRVVTAAVAEVQAGTGRSVEFASDPELPLALADELRQRQILDNLLGNAVKFSPAGSTIHVSVRGNLDHLEVRVTDEGPGISAADRTRLFEPFTRLERARATEGSGLGLYSARLLTEGQGGTIRVESEDGAGASFVYTVMTVVGADRR